MIACPSLRHKCGSLLKDDLKELWQENDFLISLRNQEFCSDECKKCKHIYTCKGGCRACASATTKSMYGNDPYINLANLY